jgi:hypothetical protein
MFPVSACSCTEGAGGEVDLWEVKVSDGIGLIQYEAQENNVI